MDKHEAANMVALIKAINGNKAAVSAIDDGGVPPWWTQRLMDGTADQWVPVLEAFARDGVVEIEQTGVGGDWIASKSVEFNFDLAHYRPAQPKPLCVWAVVRDRGVVCVNFSEGAANLEARHGDRVVKLVEEVEK